MEILTENDTWNHYDPRDIGYNKFVQGFIH